MESVIEKSTYAIAPSFVQTAQPRIYSPSSDALGAFSTSISTNVLKITAALWQTNCEYLLNSSAERDNDINSSSYAHGKTRVAQDQTTRTPGVSNLPFYAASDLRLHDRESSLGPL